MRDVLVYLAGPISKGDLVHNISQADGAFFALLKAGVPAICPHWSCFAGSVYRSTYEAVCGCAHVLPEQTTHAEWYGMDLAIVRRCDAVLRLPGESTGADLETAEAQQRGIPVFHSTWDVLTWVDTRQPTELSRAHTPHR